MDKAAFGVTENEDLENIVRSLSDAQQCSLCSDTLKNRPRNSTVHMDGKDSYYDGV